MTDRESQRPFELAHVSVITDQPEWEHIKGCASCGIALFSLNRGISSGKNAVSPRSNH